MSEPLQIRDKFSPPDPADAEIARLEAALAQWEARKAAYEIELSRYAYERDLTRRERDQAEARWQALEKFIQNNVAKEADINNRGTPARLVAYRYVQAEMQRLAGAPEPKEWSWRVRR